MSDFINWSTRKSRARYWQRRHSYLFRGPNLLRRICILLIVMYAWVKFALWARFG